VNLVGVEGVLTGFLALVFIYAAAWRHLLGRHLLLTAPAAFLIVQLPNALGTVLNADFTSNFDLFWVALRLTALAAFVIGAIYASHRVQFRAREETASFRSAPLTDDLKGSVSGVFLAGAIVVCVFVGVFFASRIGYNTFALSLRTFFLSGSVDGSQFSALRQAATREGYAAAGYAVQFTAVLLPASIMLVYLRGRLKGDTILVAAAAVLTLLNIYFVTVIGGRKYLIGAIAMAIALLIPVTTPLARGLRASRSTGVLLIFGVLTLFGFTTLLQGRRTPAGDDTSLLALSTVGLYNRIGGLYSQYQFESIRLLRDDPIAWGGLWIEQLKIALPGPTQGPSFDARLHGMLYDGNIGGNAPLDFWGSTYYNWGAIGLILLAFLLGFLFQAFNIRFLIRAEKSLTRVVLLSWAGYRLALWRDPYSMLLEGSLTLLLFYGLHRAAKGPEKRPTVDVRPPTREGAAQAATSRDAADN